MYVIHGTCHIITNSGNCWNGDDSDDNDEE